MMIMRRWAPRIFVFLLLGAIVNVAVAWACAWIPRATIDGPRWSWPPAGSLQWKRPMHLTSSPPEMSAHRAYRGISIDYLIAPDYSQPPPIGRASLAVLFMQVIIAFGLPCASMDYELDSVVDQPNAGAETVSLQWALCNSPPPSYTNVVTWNDPTMSSPTVCLPLRPIWRGSSSTRCFTRECWGCSSPRRSRCDAGGAIAADFVRSAHIQSATAMSAPSAASR
jgi:hypothetical protein